MSATGSRFLTSQCVTACTLFLTILPALDVWPLSDVSISKSVTPQVPLAGQGVEFEIIVSNAGPDAALDLHLVETLPDALQVPAGMAVFVSQGTYDADGGDWAIGNIAAGAMATMTVPAQLVSPVSPPCIVNTVNIGDNSAAASVRQPGVERCVDLFVENTLFSVPQPFCSDVTAANLTLLVRNNGPDEARSVEISVSQSPQRLPNFGFSDTQCAGSRAGRCDLGLMRPGELRIVTLTSDQFNNSRAYPITFQVNLFTLDVDYRDSDNYREIMREVPMTVTPPCDIPLPSGVGSPACFIATAAWGSPWNKNVATLRQFRDRRLLTNAPGRAFVDFYYRHSPAVAAYISDKPFLRATTRAALTPVVITVNHPAIVAMGGAMAFYLILILRNKWSKRADSRSPGVSANCADSTQS